MPLDFKLIQESTAYSLDKIKNITPTACPYLFLLSDFIYPPLLEKLYQLITSDQNLPWHKVAYQEHSGREAVSWLSDSAIEEVHTVFDSLTQEINQITNNNLTFMGIDVWRDVYPYTIIKHSDQELIGCAIQIYLNENDVDLATKFSVNDVTITPPYKTNYGYLMNNQGKVPHWMTSEVPQNFARYSLYAIWKH